MKQLAFCCLFLLSFYTIYCSVLELTDKNFDSVLNEKKKGMIMFYSPGCGHCQRLKPTYDELSNNKAVLANGILIAKVDCSKDGKSTCGKYSVRGYPTVMFIDRESGSEVKTQYEGNRQLNDLVKFVTDNSLPAIREVAENDIAEFITSETVPVVFGIFKDTKSPLFQKLNTYSSSNRDKFQFGYTFSKDAATKLDKKMDCVVFYRQQLYKSTLEPEIFVIDSPATLENTLDANKYSLVELRNPSNEKEFDSQLIVVYVGFDPLLSKSKFKRVRNAMIRVAKSHTDLKFLISKTDDYKEFITGFASNSGERDLHIVAYDKNGDKYLDDTVGSCEDVKGFEALLVKFVDNYLKGGVYQRYIKSEPVPTAETGHVKTVVGTTFDSIVLDDSKDVFIEFYAPWCGHCKDLAPKFEKLAKTLAGEENLVIAKLDATANEVHKDFSVQGFPTLFLAKAGQKNKPIQYNGERTVEAMIEWLKEHTKNPIKYEVAASDSKKEL